MRIFIEFTLTTIISLLFEITYLNLCLFKILILCFFLKFEGDIQRKQIKKIKSNKISYKLDLVECQYQFRNFEYVPKHFLQPLAILQTGASRFLIFFQIPFCYVLCLLRVTSLAPCPLFNVFFSLLSELQRENGSVTQSVHYPLCPQWHNAKLKNNGHGLKNITLRRPCINSPVLIGIFCKPTYNHHEQFCYLAIETLMLLTVL